MTDKITFSKTDIFMITMLLICVLVTNFVQYAYRHENRDERANALLHEVHTLTGQLAETKEELFYTKNDSITECVMYNNDWIIVGNYKTSKWMRLMFAKWRELECR